MKDCYAEIGLLYQREAINFGIKIAPFELKEHLQYVKDEGYGNTQKWRLKEDPKRPMFLYMHIDDVETVYLPYLNRIFQSRGGKASVKSLCATNSMLQRKFHHERSIKSIGMLTRYFDNEDLIKVKNTNIEQVAKFNTPSLLVDQPKTFNEFLLGLSDNKDLNDEDDDEGYIDLEDFDLDLEDFEDDFGEEDFKDVDFDEDDW